MDSLMGYTVLVEAKRGSIVMADGYLGASPLTTLVANRL